MTIGDRIKKLRTEKKLSQRELARLVGYNDHTTLTRVEGGKIDLPQSKIVQFADVLGVTPDYLLSYEEKPEDLGALAAQVVKDPELLGLVQDFQTLDAADRATVRALVASLAQKKKD